MSTNNNENPKHIGSLVMVLIAMVLWGISFIWTKQLIGIINSTLIIFLRMAIASTLLLSFGFATKSISKIAKKDIKEILILAFVQPFLYFTFEVASLKESSPTVISLTLAQIPLMVAIITVFGKKQRVPLKIIVGIIVSIAGISLVMLGGEDVSLMTTPFGFFMGICATMCALLYLFLTKRILSKYNPITVTTLIHVVAFLYFLPIVLIFHREELMSINVSHELLYPILSLGVMCSAVAFIMYSYGIKNLGVITSSMITNLSPAVTALSMFLMLNEQLSLLQIIGVTISIVGLMYGLIKRTNR